MLSENTIIVSIEGMMCPHCEAAVKKSLEALDFVESAQASHEEKTAQVKLCGKADEAAIKKAVEDAGYKVTGIK